MQIGIYNNSTLVTDADVQTMTNAIQNQVKNDLCPSWERDPVTVAMMGGKKSVPSTIHAIILVDSIQDEPAGVLGFHTENKDGKLWGTVAVEPELGNGGKILTGDWSVSSVLSHEVCEMIVDPNCNLWANNNTGRAYSLEVCDPCEAPTYSVDGVSVSNFVHPAWFDPNRGKSAQYDHLSLLHAPFTILKGGYVVYEGAGKAMQVYGDAFPEWRRAMKSGPHARTMRKVTELHTHSVD
jgi:hypothetical protein